MKAKKQIAVILVIATLLSIVGFGSISASALTVNTKYPTKNITGYILSTSNKTAVAYSNSSLSSKIGYIYSSDDCTIQAIYTNGVVKVKCPWTGYSNGRIVYTKLSYFFSNTSSVSTKTVTVKTKCYSRSNLKTSLGYVYVGDKCYIVGTSGNYYQVLCPWTNGVYRLCWVSQSAFGHTHSYTTTGVEAAHPHRVYKKCSCGAYYYTGATSKLSSCTTCYPKTSSASSSASISLNVPLYKQNDSKWKNTKIGTKTIGAVGCTTTSLAMIYSYKNNKTVYPNEMRNKLSYGGANGNDLLWTSLSKLGLSYKTYNCAINQTILKDIYTKLKEGKPVMIGCVGTSTRGQHWVVVTGYKGSTSTFSTANFTINDPGSANNTTLEQFLKNRGNVSKIAW